MNARLSRDGAEPCERHTLSPSTRGRCWHRLHKRSHAYQFNDRELRATRHDVLAIIFAFMRMISPPLLLMPPWYRHSTSLSGHAGLRWLADCCAAGRPGQSFPDSPLAARARFLARRY